jgi:hypothetical protein
MQTEFRASSHVNAFGWMQKDKQASYYINNKLLSQMELTVTSCEIS